MRQRKVGNKAHRINFLEVVWAQAQQSHNQPLSLRQTLDSDIKTIEYYDNYYYDFDDNPSVIYSYSAAGFSPEPIPALQNKGRLVCSKKRNLSNNNWLITIYHYDKYGRRIQERSNNHKNYVIQNSVTSQYDFGGLPLIKKEVINTTLDVITIIERYEYSNTRKLKNVYHKINNQSEILLTSIKLNELGQMVEKNMHSENGGSTFLQSVDFTYNIRNWLTHINNGNLTNSSLNSTPEDNNNDTNDLFGIEMVFDKTVSGTTSMYNGSISSVFWKTTSSAQGKSYKYSYDGFNQLTDASYGNNQSGVFQYGNPYSEKDITYDKNGNIKTLKRYTDASTATDDLIYIYASTGNQLNQVEDASSSLYGFRNRVSQVSEMTYDANGNLSADGNKGITSIVYNHLNLPVTVIFGASGNNNRLEFVYDASGKMLSRERIQAGAIVMTLDYAGSVYYENNICHYILTPEGRAVKSGSIYSYQYFIKDHLGNTRVIFDKDNISGNAQIVQEDHYYAFGMQMSHNGGDHSFRYSGKEYQQGMDLNNDLDNEYDWDVYDFGARMYDPRLGRWFNPDPLDQFTDYTPYGYCLNSPMLYSDPDGRWVGILIGALFGAWAGGTAANDGQINPFKWEKSGSTFAGMAIGAGLGAAGGYFTEQVLAKNMVITAGAYTNTPAGPVGLMASTDKYAGVTLGASNGIIGVNWNHSSTLRLHSTYTYIYDGQNLTADKVIDIEAGQHVKVVIKNMNTFGGATATLTESSYQWTYVNGKRKEYVGESYNVFLRQGASAYHDWYRFNYSPMPWKFVVAPLGDASSLYLKIEIYSTWIPGDPIDKNNPTYR